MFLVQLCDFSPGGFALRSPLASAADTAGAYDKKITREMLDASLLLGKDFLLNSQQPEGNFIYTYNFVNKKLSESDNQVRQAGALWGLALMYHDAPSGRLAAAIEKGFAFFASHSKTTSDGRKYIVYPGAQTGKTGTVALVTLALIDFLRAQEDIELREQYEKDLDGYIRSLLSLRMKNGQLHRGYCVESGEGIGEASPYYDGESLLAFVKAAKYMGYDHLVDMILMSADEMYEKNVREALAVHPDSRVTKGFYQWASLAYYEMYTAGWPGVEEYADRVIDLAYWMIDVHRTLERQKNTAYAHEGLIVAWRLAQLTQKTEAMNKIGRVVDTGLYKLTSWQVGGPLNDKNEFLKTCSEPAPWVIGAVMNSKRDPELRVDVTQHQMHAVILARRYMYPPAYTSLEETVPSEDGTIWFDNIHRPFSLDSDEGEMLMRCVADSVLHSQPFDTEKLSFLQEDVLARIVFLSISDGITSAHVFLGTGKGIIDAVEEAISKAEEIKDTGYRPRWIKLDVVQDVSSRQQVDFDDALDLQRGFQGIAFDRHVHDAFLPEEAAIHWAVDYEPTQQPRHYVLKAGVLDNRADVDVYYFSTLSYFSDGNTIDTLYRGHRLFDQSKITPQVLLTAAKLGGKYLVRMVGEDGKFVYFYRPFTDEPGKDYNILRHSGTIYAMMELYEITRDAALLRAVKRGIAYLLSAVRPALDQREDAVCVVENGYVKLGGNALAIIALAKYTEVTGDRQYMPVILRLGKWIRSVQNKKGLFTIHKQAYPHGTVSNFVSRYYPGEALLAMIRLYALDPDEQWLRVAEKGAEYLISVRDRKQPLEDHWLLYALNELYRYRPRSLYVKHTRRTARTILRQQNRTASYPDWVGGYFQPPRSAATAARSEGLYAAYMLLRDAGLASEAKRILDAIKLGVSFQLQTQFRPDTVLYLPNPQEALGGFRENHRKLDVRIDYVQHNISGLLGLYRIMNEFQNDAKQGKDEQCTVLFVGDTSFGESYQAARKRAGKEDILEKRGYEYLLEKLKPVLSQSDFVVANLETPIPGSVVSPFGKRKKYINRGREETAVYLKKFHVKAVSLANNHALDYGRKGLRQTIDVLRKNNVGWFGAGMNEPETLSPYIWKCNVGQQVFTLAVIGGFEYTRQYDRDFDFYAGKDTPGVAPLSVTKISRRIKKLKAATPDAFVVVFPHWWGKDYRGKTKDQTEIARKIIDAGADILIGHGAHMMQGVEKYRGRWILYDLGNFVFGSPGRYQKLSAEPFSLCARLLVKDAGGDLVKQMRLYPIYTDNLITNYQSRFLTEAEFEKAYQLMGDRSEGELPQGMRRGKDNLGMFFEFLLESKGRNRSGGA